MDMIEKIAVENFKSHAHTEISLGRVTALVGPNGCGKTAILQSIHYLSQLTDQTVDIVFSQERDPSHLLRRGCQSFSLSVGGRQTATPQQKSTSIWNVAVTLAKAQAEATSHPGWSTEVKWQLGDEKSSGVYMHSGQTLLHAQVKPEVMHALQPVAYFKAALKNLSSPSYSEKTLPRVAFDGTGLASAAAYLMTAEPERHQVIEEALRNIVPAVKRVRAKPAKVILRERRVFSVNEARVPYDEQREVTGHELTFDTIGADGVPAHAMSDGTLLAYGLLTILYSLSNTQLFLLDDVEQGLHPLAQRRLINTLKEFAKEQDRQILLTTHSPYIVDELDAKNVWVMALDQEGVSHAKRLSDHPDIERGLSVLTTGEIWGAEGEDWVLNDPLPTETANA
ncbi:MAG: AAA family ATPase [Blastocatellia bacterium]